MNNSQYLDKHQAEVFVKIAEAMFGAGGDWIWKNKFHCIVFNPITNAEQRWELAVFLFREIESNKILGAKLVNSHKLRAAMLSDNPPRELVLAAIEIIGIGDKS